GTRCGAGPATVRWRLRWRLRTPAGGGGGAGFRGAPALKHQNPTVWGGGAYPPPLDRVDVLVNNAGGAKGMAPVAEADLDDWRWMWETNVLGTLRLTKALLPKLIASGDSLIVTITSIAAFHAYPNGSGYTSAKHAQAVLHRTLRDELLGQPVRLTEIAPGAVETEFSLVRFDGDAERAAKVYEGIDPLYAQDIAEIVGFVASRPPHVNLDTIVVKPRDQAGPGSFARRS
ncbi:SDR family NAD(P)-dependent oxidoreductase, partial [Nocardia sp. NPDC058497]|uniref:SDR family NAD(P)-dependent oxidoreductase n=1 Tax=Nocardia sp. NPDC058497 TaxID=3346529 RepID=UPI003656467C